MITSDTTFHGYRGVVEQYKVTVKKIRKFFARIFRSKIYRWKVGQWIEQGLIPPGSILPDVLRHVVHGPAWNYVDPEKDAKADVVRIESHLASPRQVQAERGRDYEEVVREIVEDGAQKIAAAVEKADELEAAGVEDVSWRDVLSAGTGAPPEPKEEAPAPIDVEPEPAEVVNDA